jgi:UDP-N-acetylmuramate--alanine ligase
MNPSDPPIHVRRPQCGPAERFDADGRHIYMIGIGGCGMAGLARMLACRGAVVAGSDVSSSEATEALESEGIRVGFDQSRPWLPEACDVVVASAAIRPDHPQILEADRRGIAVLSYAEALGRCMLGRTGVAIAGTHGKSTTTAMLGTALTDAGLDPTVIVGATCPQLVCGALGQQSGDEVQAGILSRTDQIYHRLAASKCAPSGFRLGGDPIPAGGWAGRPGILIAEACEFNRSFHNYRPVIASISSVEADHLDVYGSLDAVIQSFHEFAQLIAPASQGGKLLIAHDNAHRRIVAAGLECDVETIGFSPEADWVVGYDAEVRRATLCRGKEVLARWTMRLPGAHNAMNAATACALATMLGADPEIVARSLAAFAGIDRRMQFLGERALARGGSVRVYDDYGHHPTEVDATLRALRDFERPHERDGRLICVFQPHQHSRTRHLMEEFASAFGCADVVIVPHIYFVRDTQEEKHKVTAADLVDRLRQRSVRAMHLYPFDAIVEQLENLCRDGDVLVVMGAGPVYQVGQGYMQSSKPAQLAGV